MLSIIRRNPDTALNTLMPYCITITTLTLATHIIAAIVPQDFTFITIWLGTALVASFLAAYCLTYGKGLDRLRFGGVMAHTFTYAVLTTSVLLHVVLATGNGAFTQPPLADWGNGFTIFMGAFWGLGLLVHMFAVIANRGFEATSVLGTEKATQ